MVVTLKCRKCRHDLVKDDPSLSAVICAHGEHYVSQSEDSQCFGTNKDSLWFLDESAIAWIFDVIAKAQWTKGKLNCPNCESRVGSFDYLCRSKCACGSHILPAVHLVKSKVDVKRPSSNLLEVLKSESVNQV